MKTALAQAKQGRMHILRNGAGIEAPHPLSVTRPHRAIGTSSDKIRN